MPLSISYTNGKGCSLPEGGCAVILQPNAQTSLVNTNYYLLLSGTADVTYGNLPAQKIVSPYSGSEWQSYVDTWTYGVDTQIAVNRTTSFIQVIADNCSVANLVVTTVDNRSMDIAAKPNSYIAVVGSIFSVDGVPYTNQICKIFQQIQQKTVNVQSRDICKVLYVEQA